MVEVRYRTVTRTDSEGNDYEVEVPYNYYILGQNVLAVKEVLQRPAHLVQCPRALMECGDHGDQYIGIVFNLSLIHI